MANMKHEVNKDGSVSVVVTRDEPLKNKKGKTIGVQQKRWWTRNVDQARKHIATWEHKEQPAAERLSRGEKSALMDKLSEVHKQLKS